MAAETYVVIQNIAKRHNVGTLARSAPAFGVSESILVGCRDFNAFCSHGSTSHLRFRHFHSLSNARLYLKGKKIVVFVGLRSQTALFQEHGFLLRNVRYEIPLFTFFNMEVALRHCLFECHCCCFYCSASFWRFCCFCGTYGPSIKELKKSNGVSNMFHLTFEVNSSSYVVSLELFTQPILCPVNLLKSCCSELSFSLKYLCLPSPYTGMGIEL
ncbi:hypothetical protein V6N13_037656 [Hibiscus sabdariffa]